MLPGSTNQITVILFCKLRIPIPCAIIIRDISTNLHTVPGWSGTQPSSAHKLQVESGNGVRRRELASSSGSLSSETEGTLDRISVPTHPGLLLAATMSVTPSKLGSCLFLPSKMEIISICFPELPEASTRSSVRWVLSIGGCLLHH